MRKKVVIAALCLACLSIAVLICFFYGEPIENEADAAAVARNYVKWKYREEFEEYEVHVREETDHWRVWYSLPPLNGAPFMGDGGPEVHILKANGRVIYCMLTK